MDIKDCTKTVGGHPWRFYADDGGKHYPIHGAWHCPCNCWIPGEWNHLGEKRGMDDNGKSLDLDLTDWRDQIPWECIRDEVEWVTWSKDIWMGFTCKPRRDPAIWAFVDGRCFDLSGHKMPQPPSDWREAIARRPG